jgi:hypothetical protein
MIAADLLGQINFEIYWLLDWLLFYVNSEIFQLYYGEFKVIFNEMMVRSGYTVLDFLWC